jgi:hypothetical protein
MLGSSHVSASHALRDKLFIVALVVAVVPLLAAGLLLATAMQSRLRAAAADDAAQVGEMVRVVAADRGQRLVASAQAFSKPSSTTTAIPFCPSPSSSRRGSTGPRSPSPTRAAPSWCAPTRPSSTAS